MSFAYSGVGRPVAALVLDCDGVLLDSNDLKTHSFREALFAAGYGATEIDSFTDLQTRSFGLSRYHLIRAFFTEILGQPVDDAAERALLTDFAARCRNGYLTVEETPGLRDFLDRWTAQVPLFVASGSDETELREIFAHRGLESYFTAVYGSPRPKADSVALALQDLGEPYPKDAIWMVGDAKSDYRAAQINGIGFVYMSSYSTVRDEMEPLSVADGFATIRNLTEMDALLGEGAHAV